MSSVTRKFSQIPVRVKYLLGLPGASASTSSVPSDNSAFTLSPGAHLDLGSIATNADISGTGVALGFASYTDLSGALFKDMGRQLVIYDPATAEHIAVFRQVQRVQGATTEGVGVSAPTTPETYLANIYVKVWSADGTDVVVVRTG
jgi:hypothetical protein